MKKQLLLLTFTFASFVLAAQTITVSSAPASADTGEEITVSVSFDTGGNAATDIYYELRELSGSSGGAGTWKAGTLNDITDAVSGTDSWTFTIPANLDASLNYDLVVNYKIGSVWGPGGFQAIDITEALVPTINQSVITSADILVDANGKATGWVPTPSISITLENFTPNTTYTVFNQFKINDTNGTQWGGGSIAITTDASGNGVDTTWNPGFFGTDGTFNGTETVGYWNSNVTGPAGAVSKNQTFAITQNTTLSSKDFSIVNVAVYPNPTTNRITIETQQKFTSVNIYDITGKTVKTFKSEKTLDVANLNNGIYFLKTNTGLAAKFVKK